MAGRCRIAGETAPNRGAGGGLPLALGTGMGSELRHPLGVTIVGGLLVSQVLTLYSTPVIYLAFDRVAARFSRRGRDRAAEVQDAEVSAVQPFGMEVE